MFAKRTAFFVYICYTAGHHYSTVSLAAAPIALRRFQAECIDACLTAFHQHGIRRQLISLPVGSGKTVVFSHLLSRIPDPSPAATKTLILSHREELIDQAFSNSETAASLASSPFPALLHSEIAVKALNPQLVVDVEQADRTASVGADVVIASVPTVGRTGTSRLHKYDPSTFKTIIIDEAHHACAASYVRVLDYFGARSPSSHIFLWGCTATIARHDGLDLGNVFQNLVYHKPMLELIQEKYLCAIRSKVLMSKQSLEVEPQADSEDYNVDALSRAVNISDRNELIVEGWQEFASGKRHSTLVFAVDVAHVRSLVEEFQLKGICAHSVDASTPKAERADIIHKFKTRQIPVLVNCGVFIEGIDIPCIDCLIMARPTLSSVLFTQMLGRGIRTFEGKEDCLILDIVDSFANHRVPVTLPSLFQLRATFDAEGMDILHILLARDRRTQRFYSDEQLFGTASSQQPDAAAHCPRPAGDFEYVDVNINNWFHSNASQENGQPQKTEADLKKEADTDAIYQQILLTSALAWTRAGAGRFVLRLGMQSVPAYGVILAVNEEELKNERMPESMLQLLKSYFQKAPKSTIFDKTILTPTSMFIAPPSLRRKPITKAYVGYFGYPDQKNVPPKKICTTKSQDEAFFYLEKYISSRFPKKVSALSVNAPAWASWKKNSSHVDFLIKCGYQKAKCYTSQTVDRLVHEIQLRRSSNLPLHLDNLAGSVGKLCRLRWHVLRHGENHVAMNSAFYDEHELIEECYLLPLRSTEDLGVLEVNYNPETRRYTSVVANWERNGHLSPSAANKLKVFRIGESDGLDIITMSEQYLKKNYDQCVSRLTRNAQWHDEEATPKQLKFLDNLRVHYSRPITKKEAGRLIDNALEKKTSRQRSSRTKLSQLINTP